MVEAFLQWVAGLPSLAIYGVLIALSAVENIFPPVPADVAVVLVGGARWSDRDAGTAQQAVAQPNAAAQAEPATFDYFPAQYVNQATEAEEHIQAF